MLQIGTMTVMGAMIAVAWFEEPRMNTAPHVREEIRQGTGLNATEIGIAAPNKRVWLHGVPETDAAGGALPDFASLKLNADFFRQQLDLIRTTELAGPVSLFYGVGGRLQLRGSDPGKSSGGEDPRLGVRIPVGLAYAFKENPFELYAEVAPHIDVAPEPQPGIGVGIGARYRFSLR